MSTADQLTEYLQDLNPTHLALENESMQHAGYFEGKESHFKLTIVSDAFAGKRPVARHQQVYALAGPLLTSAGGTIHALAIHAYTPDEWAATGAAPDSPLCAGKNI
ncbi:BolA family transcriptional regulator [Psychrobacter arenosus]|uniref:BolA family protein n=1 Tax=Psychrobacter arenosus TaxID=256326 RepID=UPI0019183A22|nr:BolA family protein [Psychrobacter arenosus]